MRKLFILSILMISPLALGQDSATTADDVVTAQAVKTTKGQTAHVIVHKNSHVLGLPYVVELRPSCGSKLAWQKLTVKGAESVCDVQSKFIKYDSAKNEVIVRVKKAHAELANFNSVNDKATEAIACESRWSLVTFNLKDVCQ